MVIYATSQEVYSIILLWEEFQFLTYRKVRWYLAEAAGAEIIAHIYLFCLQENSASSYTQLIAIQLN